MGNLGRTIAEAAGLVVAGIAIGWLVHDLTPIRRRLWDRFCAWRTQRRVRPYLDRADAIFRESEETMDIFAAVNKARDPDWDGSYTREQRAALDRMRLQAQMELNQAFPQRKRHARNARQEEAV